MILWFEQLAEEQIFLCLLYDVIIIMHNFAKNSKFNDVLGPAWYFVKHDLV